MTLSAVAKTDLIYTVIDQNNDIGGITANPDQFNNFATHVIPANVLAVGNSIDVNFGFNIPGANESDFVITIGNDSNPLNNTEFYRQPNERGSDYITLFIVNIGGVNIKKIGALDESSIFPGEPSLTKEIKGLIDIAQNIIVAFFINTESGASGPNAKTVKFVRTEILL